MGARQDRGGQGGGGLQAPAASVLCLDGHGPWNPRDKSSPTGDSFASPLFPNVDSHHPIMVQWSPHFKKENMRVG